MYIGSGKAYAYIKFLVYFSLFTLIFSMTVPGILSRISKTYLKNERIKLLHSLSQTLDNIEKDLTFSDKLSVKNNKFLFSKDNIVYELTAYKERLARRKKNYTYLSDKKIRIIDLKINTLSKNLYKLSFTAEIKGKNYNFKRIIQWQN